MTPLTPQIADVIEASGEVFTLGAVEAVRTPVQHLQHWSQGGNAITNFSPSRLPIYERAIREYGDSSLYIGEPTPRGLACDKALRVRGLNGAVPCLSDFWAVFARVDAEAKEQL